VVWLQRRTGLGFQLWDCGLFTVARYAQRYWFVGVLNTWLPVPVNWMATLITQSRSLWKVQLVLTEFRVGFRVIPETLIPQNTLNTRTGWLPSSRSRARFGGCSLCSHPILHDPVQRCCCI